MYEGLKAFEGNWGWCNANEFVENYECVGITLDEIFEMLNNTFRHTFKIPFTFKMGENATYGAFPKNSRSVLKVSDDMGYSQIVVNEKYIPKCVNKKSYGGSYSYG